MIFVYWRSHENLFDRCVLACSGMLKYAHARKSHTNTLGYLHGVKMASNTYFVFYFKAVKLQGFQRKPNSKKIKPNFSYVRGEACPNICLNLV